MDGRVTARAQCREGRLSIRGVDYGAYPLPALSPSGTVSQRDLILRRVLVYSCPFMEEDQYGSTDVRVLRIVEAGVSPCHRWGCRCLPTTDEARATLAQYLARSGLAVGKDTDFVAIDHAIDQWLRVFEDLLRA